MDLMSKARNNENQKIESIEPLILMSASAADIGNVIDLTDANLIIADEAHESAVGTSGDDIIIGLGGDNCLHGGDGDDLFFTTSGNNNEVDGEGGTDTIRYLGDRSEFSVVALSGGGFMISDDGDRVDRVYNVEKFEFNDGVVMAADLLSGNDAPVFTTGQHFMVPENTTAVTTVQATDANGDTLVYSLGTAADGEFFDIDPNTGVLTFKNAPDFENPLDDNGDNVYDVFIKVSDGKTTTIQVIWVGVTDVNETGGGNQSPFFTNVSDGEMIFVAENTTAVKDTDATDPDGDTLTYSFSDGINTPGDGPNQDPGLFNIDPQTGVLSFKVAPDFENPGDADGDNEYRVTIVVSDGKGGAQERNVIVKVTDVNENGANQNPFFTNVEQNEMVTVVENNTLVGDANGIDPDGDTVIFSIAGGVDAALFTVDPATGVVSFINAPDFENPGDAGANNQYNLTLRISDGTLFQDRDVIVKVLDATEGSANQNPYFTNVSEGEVVTVPENTTLVGDANGVDPDGDTVSFSIVGGVDASLFTVDSVTGVVSFITAPDFEAPADADGNNNYQITLRVSDGKGGTQDRNVTVRVTDVGNDGGTGNQNPFFTNVEEGEVVTVPENTTPVGDADGVDPDGDTVTFSIVGGADAARFTINSATGVVSFINAPDFEAPSDADGNNNYQIRLRISDGNGGTQDRNVTVRVTDVGNEGGGGNNQAPYFTNVGQGEVVTVVTGTTAVGDANAQDPNGDTIIYSISGGADAALFTVNAQTGVVSFINAPDVNNPGDADGNNSYLITLRASDGSLFQDRNVVVNVIASGQQGNRAPVFTNVSQGEVVWFDENGTFVGDANAVDADGDVLTFSVVGGADASKFTINAQTGELFFINAPDFENPGDANGNNLYELVIRVSDGKANVDRTIGVNVEDVNEGGGKPGHGGKPDYGGKPGYGGGGGNGGVSQINQIDLTNIFTQLLNGLNGVHPYTGPSVY